MGVLAARGGDVGTGLARAVGTVVDAGLVVEAAGIDVGLGDRVGRRAVERRAGSQRRAVGRGAGQTAAVAIGDRHVGQGHVAVVGGDDVVVDDVAGLREGAAVIDLGDRQEGGLAARGGDVGSGLARAVGTVVDAGLVVEAAGIDVGLGDRVGPRFFFKRAATPEISALSLHDALPIFAIGDRHVGQGHVAVVGGDDVVVDDVAGLREGAA